MHGGSTYRPVHTRVFAIILVGSTVAQLVYLNMTKCTTELLGVCGAR